MFEPHIPESVTKSLTYWHRSSSRAGNGRSKLQGETRQLYNIEERVSRVTQQVAPHLITLPGFAYKIKTLAEEAGFEVNFIDDRSTLPAIDIPKALSKLRPYQHPAAYTMLKSYGGILACPTGFGKCVNPTTPVLYADGTVRQMGDVEIGHELMGDDSQPRRVLHRIDGNGPMYRITPKNGEPFEVADHHILCLVKSGTCKRDKYPDGNIVEITVEDYLKKSKTFKHRHKLYKVAVAWSEEQVEVDPYWLGVWLGDGNWESPVVTTPDTEVKDAICKYATEIGSKVSVYAGTCKRYAIVTEPGKPNPLRVAMGRYGLLKNKKKHIPKEYLVNSRSVRLQLLAGLLDSDGSLAAGTVFEFSGTNPELVDSVAFLARSLGFRVHQKVRKCYGFGKEVTATRLCISGETQLIPTKVVRKQATARLQKKNPLRTSFTVEPIPEGPYVGVQLDGNHRYLLGDFTVTHNTHTMAGIIRGFSRAELTARNTPLTVVVTPGVDLAKKNAQALEDILGNERDVGLVCTGIRDFSDDVQVITPESLHNIDLKNCGLLLYDEVHTLSSSRADSVMEATHAIRYGFSATPTGRCDGADLVVEGCFGPIVYKKTYQEAVEDGAVVPIEVIWIPTSMPRRWRQFKTRDGTYRNGVWNCGDFHQLTKNILDKIPEDMQTLAVVDKLSHMDNLLQYAPELAYVHGSERDKDLVKLEPKTLKGIPRKKREEIYKLVESGEAMRVVSSGIYRTGVDFPKLAVLLNLAGMQSSIINTQLPGRTGRTSDGKDCAFLIDFWHGWDWNVNKSGKNVPGPLLKDCKAREKVYRALEFSQRSVENLDNLFS